MSGPTPGAVWFAALVATAACSFNDDVPAPLVASVVPARAVAGALVTISGDHFCQRPITGHEDPTCPSVGTVDFGLSPGITAMWSDVAITAEVPSLAPGPVTVTVVAAGRVSNAVTFTVE
jgi:uncharacterized protein (TIGR03437 family)